MQRTAKLGGFWALVLATALSACSGPSSTVTPEEARTLVKAGATLLDVRSPGEWTQSHIEGAVLVPIDQISARMAEISRDRPVVVYCASGGRSAAGTAALRSAGYDARDLGAMSRWYQ